MIPDVLPRPAAAPPDQEPGPRVDDAAFDAALTAAVGTGSGSLDPTEPATRSGTGRPSVPEVEVETETETETDTEAETDVEAEAHVPVGTEVDIHVAADSEAGIHVEPDAGRATAATEGVETPPVPAPSADGRPATEADTTHRPTPAIGSVPPSDDAPEIARHRDPGARAALATRTGADQDAVPASHDGGDIAEGENSGRTASRGADPEAVPPADAGDPTGDEPTGDDGDGPTGADAAEPVLGDDGDQPPPGEAPDEVTAAPPRRGASPAPAPADPQIAADTRATTVAQAPPTPDVASPPTPATTAAAPPAPAQPPPPVAQQLVGHVSPLLDGAEGTHELTIELTPDELGRVRLEVRLEDGLLHVRVHADDPVSRRLLAESMGELRAALTEAGVRAGDLDVGDDAPPRTGDDGPGPDRHPSRGRGRPDDPAPTADPTRTNASGRSAIDVLL